MADCKYCEQSASFFSYSHPECKVKYYNTMVGLMLEGKPHKPEEKSGKSNLKFTELSQVDLELLDSTFLKRGAESWIWMQKESVLHLAEVETNIKLRPERGFGSLFEKETGKMEEKVKFKKQNKGLFAISNKALHGVVNSGPIRWPLEAIGQISAFNNSGLANIANTYKNIDLGVSDRLFEVRMSETMGKLPTHFLVVTSEDEQLLDSQLLLIKDLIRLSDHDTPSPNTDSSPTQRSVDSGKSMVEKLQDLAQLKEQGILTDEEFTIAKQRILQEE